MLTYLFMYANPQFSGWYDVSYNDPSLCPPVKVTFSLVVTTIALILVFSLYMPVLIILSVSESVRLAKVLVAKPDNEPVTAP